MHTRSLALVAVKSAVCQDVRREHVSPVTAPRHIATTAASLSFPRLTFPDATLSHTHTTTGQHHNRDVVIS